MALFVMLTPYRTPALIEPEPPSPPCAEPYRGPGQCPGCAAFPPEPRRFFARIGGHARPWRARTLFVWAMGVSLLALVFMATSTATMAVLASRMTALRQAGAPGYKAPPPKAIAQIEAPQKRVAAPAPPTPPLPNPPKAARPEIFSLSALGRPTHAPPELFRRATALAAAGIDVLVLETTINAGSRDDIERELAPSARIAPALTLPGIRIWGLSPGSLARAAGLTEGDLVTAVNGYTLDSPDAALNAYTSLREGQSAVIELLRAGRPMVIKVDWKTAPHERPRPT